MRPETLKYLYDIQQACRLLREFTHGRSFDDYLKNPLLQSAVERQFIIVGEALVHALKIEPELKQSIADANLIVDFRNVMVHGYASIKPETVWGVVEEELSTLIREIDELLEIAGRRS